MEMMKTFENYMIVLFGSTGDLTKRKLIPSLYRLFSRKIIDASVPILCIGRRDYNDEQYLQHLETDRFINMKDNDFDGFTKQIHYFKFDFTQADCGRCVEGCTGCDSFREKMVELKRAYKCSGDTIYYFATPPSSFHKLAEIIKRSGEIKAKGRIRIAFEKPFGKDLKSSQELNKFLKAKFKENEIFRIDHYLGKALVQEIITLRFANALFEHILNKTFVDHIQITAAENLGVEERAGYYDQAGAIRDMFQNHILQILALIAMDRPKSLSGNDIRDKKVEALKKIQSPSKEDIVIGQYDRNLEQNVKGYLEEKNIDKKSKTETYIAARLKINMPKWKGVPIYIRTGKRLKESFAEINIVLKDVSKEFYKTKINKNTFKSVITIRIQPDTGMAMTFNTKIPASRDLKLTPVLMDFCHSCLFGLNTPEAYEALFQAIIMGDLTIFERWDGVEASWTYIDKVKDIASKKSLSKYEALTSGPAAANRLLIKDGRRWINDRFY